MKIWNKQMPASIYILVSRQQNSNFPFVLRSEWSLILLMTAGLQTAAKLKHKSLTEVMKERALLLHSQMINIFPAKANSHRRLTFVLCV